MVEATHQDASPSKQETWLAGDIQLDFLAPSIDVGCGTKTVEVTGRQVGKPWARHSLSQWQTGRSARKGPDADAFGADSHLGWLFR